MKVILNKVTTYQGRILAYGDTVDVELRVADRWITRGLAHLPETVKTESVKKFVEEKKDIPEITYADLDGITEVDPIEPIPVDKYVSFDEPKKTKRKLFHR